MPLFYLDVREGPTLHSDPLGDDLADLKAAELEAVALAAALARDRFTLQSVREITVEVRNEKGDHMLSVTILMRTDHVH